MNISGYSDILSAKPGGKLLLHVSTDSPQFRVEFYRLGVALDGPLAGTPMPDIRIGKNVSSKGPSDDWGWPSYAFTIPENWSSGVYIAMFVEVDQNGVDLPNQPLDRSTADGIDRKAMFVVRAALDTSRPILFKLPTATYQAYNYTGGGSTYRDGSSVASLLRPGNGTGGPTTFAKQGTPYPQIDVYDSSSDRMKIVHLEARFIHWLEKNGYSELVDYCTDFDLHFDETLLNPYQLLLSVGHDEYWSEAMRYSVVTFVKRNGNMAFFSGNTCYKYITFQNDWQFTNHGTWPQANKPVEDSFTGVSYRHVNGRWDGWRQVVGYTLQHKDHWILDNVNGPVIGDVYNNDSNQKAGLIGYECDGTPGALKDGVMVPIEQSTPTDFVILGYAQLDDTWQDVPPATDGTNFAAMGVYTDGGVVFTAGTVDWARVLDSGLEPRVEQLTRNVINRLGGTPKGLTTLSNLKEIVACDGFFSPDDNCRHAMVGTGDGNLFEIFFNPQTGQGQTVVAKLDGLVDIGAFFSDDDSYRHALVATADGNLWEVFFNPTTGSGQTILGNFLGIARVAGFFSQDDNYRHAIVATNDGDVYEMFFNPQFGQGQTLLGNFEGIVDIGAFFSKDDKYRHVIVATNDGNVTEVFFHPQFGQGQTILGNFPGIIRVNAFYAGNDAFFNRRVVVVTDDGRLHQVKFGPQAGKIVSSLANISGIIDIGGFFSSDDDFRHVIIATAGEDIQELFYGSED